QPRKRSDGIQTQPFSPIQHSPPRQEPYPRSTSGSKYLQAVTNGVILFVIVTELQRGVRVVDSHHEVRKYIARDRACCFDVLQDTALRQHHHAGDFQDRLTECSEG